MKRKLFSCLLLALLGANVVFASETIDCIYYDLDATTRTATVATGTYSGAVVIPEKVTYNNREYTVTAIAASAFNGKSITSVVIPGTISEISTQAFYYCTSLNSVTIAEGCEVINTKAFYGCTSLNSVTIAESCEVINSYAFYGCSALTKIVIPASVKRIEEQAFANCSTLAEVTLNEGLTYIGDYAFGALQKLKSITIPSTVEDMGIASFYNCRKLAKIVWNPIHCSDFTYAKNAPFSSYSYYAEGCNIKYTTFDDMSNYNSSFTSSCIGEGSGQPRGNLGLGKGNNWTTQITFGDEVEHIPAYLCYKFQGELRNLDIPDNVKTIGDYAFYGNTNLVSLKLGVGLTEIGKYAFSECSKLTELSIPDNVTTINQYAFSSCTSLATVTFGKGIQTLGTYAFGNGGKLTAINTYAVNPPTIDNTVFTKYSDLMVIDLNVREQALDAYEKANIWKDMHIGLVANESRVFSLTVSSADNTKGTTTPSGSYDEGDNIVIGAMPKDGYHFARWNDGNTDNPRLVEVTGDLTFTAYFAEGSAGTPTPSGNAYQVNISGENCSMNISSQYPEGSVVTMQAVPDECLEFKQWSDGNKDNPRTITVTADGNYKAEFNKITYTISGKAEDANSGSVNVRAK